MKSATIGLALSYRYSYFLLFASRINVNYEQIDNRPSNERDFRAEPHFEDASRLIVSSGKVAFHGAISRYPRTANSQRGGAELL